MKAVTRQQRAVGSRAASPDAALAFFEVPNWDLKLDPDNDKVLLEMVQRAAAAIGKRVSISLEDVKQKVKKAA